MNWLSINGAAGEDEHLLSTVEVLRVSPRNDDDDDDDASAARVEAATDDEWRPQYRLLYFNLRGIVEGIRLLLALAEVQYEDCRYPMTAGFGVDASFLKDQSSGTFRANLDQLPVLQVLEENDLWPLGQSFAILRFVAARHGRFGRNERERSQIDAVLEHVRDVQQKWYRSKKRPPVRSSLTALASCFADDDSVTKPSDKLTFLTSDLPNLLKKFELAVPTNPLPWLVGTEASVADVAVYHLLATPETVVTAVTASFFDGDRDRVRAALAHAPRLRACVSAVSKLPAIQHWENIRPETFA
mmetsp:Transcript_11998/g.36080  ORF Transcript_11998/g.36080 Transcript_11998/m.36080 type:complete len:300 (+) Transcript_11998:74-973(+)